MIVGGLIGAVTGATLALTTQFITALVRNYRSYRFVKKLVREEVSDIACLISERKRHIDAVVPLYPPLPTKAWDALVQSQQRWFMREKRRKALSPLYRAVAEANNYTKLLPAVLQISQLSSDESIRDAYREEAVRLLKYPLPTIEGALPDARQALRLSSDEVAQGPDEKGR